MPVQQSHHACIVTCSVRVVEGSLPVVGRGIDVRSAPQQQLAHGRALPN
eukprot:CAMPEP_0179157590 /NCGR_PEP_ID=MMETSP0796-20121207/76867_1 /TAXON_ID=73915 /ORGANISM="Pyrodinium bahamense, Strain pbaha01" /LENGTH=48 /DNA_ID= /DNA_START= /DNA_END= /DNA_ORIENTATION=